MPTDDREALATEVRHLGGRVTAAVAELHGVVINHCLLTETVLFPATGRCHREWHVPYGSVAIHNGSAGSKVTVTNATPSDTAPVAGTGVVVVPAGAAVTANITGHTLVVYGTPGERAVLSVFTKPQPPAWGSPGPL